MLGRFIRIGVDGVEMYALHNILKNKVSRVKVKMIMDKIRPLVGEIEDPNDLDEVFSVIGHAYQDYEQIMDL